MSAVKSKKQLRKKRQLRLRKKVLGNKEMPRLTVFKSLKHFYVQLIDDTAGKTLLAVNTMSKEYKENYKTSNINIQAAKNVAKLLVEKAKKEKIKSIKFDRNGYKYHGGIKAFAETLREGGLKF